MINITEVEYLNKKNHIELVIRDLTQDYFYSLDNDDTEGYDFGIFLLPPEIVNILDFQFDGYRDRLFTTTTKDFLLSELKKFPAIYLKNIDEIELL